MPAAPAPRVRRRLRRAVLAVAATSLLLAGCGGGGGGGGAGAVSSADQTTLRMAISTAMSTLDPSTVYQYEGNQVLTAVYEGLLTYADDSTAEIVPQLASAYEVSDDGLTYTFTLRDDVTFASGATMTSADVQASFERLADKTVASQMAYMVAGVDHYETPDPTTFVVVLAAPSSSFLSLVASPFGPKVIDSSVLEENAADAATSYLATATAGTGPYRLESVTEGEQYVLERNDDYWGDEPYFSSVRVKVVPDAATQVLQLQGGDLDVISGQPAATVDSFAGNDGFRVVEEPTMQKSQLHLKVTGALADPAVRTALRGAVDREALVSQVWGSHADVSTQMYPVEMLPADLATDDWEVAQADLAGTGPLTLGYLAGQAQDKQLAEALQSQWATAGADVDIEAVQANDVYSFASDVEAAPDMMLESSFPDSAHPDTWSRLFWYSDTSTGSGALNYLLGGTPAADAAIDEGNAALQEDAADQAYAAAGDAIQEQASYVTLADLKDTFITRSDITGDGHWLPCPRALDLRSLARTEG